MEYTANSKSQVRYYFQHALHKLDRVVSKCLEIHFLTLSLGNHNNIFTVQGSIEAEAKKMKDLFKNACDIHVPITITENSHCTPGPPKQVLVFWCSLRCFTFYLSRQLS